MSLWQTYVVAGYALLNFLIFIKAVHEVRNKKNVFGLAKLSGLLGIFVWGDAYVIVPFWLLTSIIVISLSDWYLFMLILSIFWAVRSSGEIIYWICEQFAVQHRNPPHTLKFYKFVNNDSIWFLYQLFWQCILVISIVCAIYFTFLWLGN